MLKVISQLSEGTEPKGPQVWGLNVGGFGGEAGVGKHSAVGQGCKVARVGRASCVSCISLSFSLSLGPLPSWAQISKEHLSHRALMIFTAKASQFYCSFPHCPWPILPSFSEVFPRTQTLPLFTPSHNEMPGVRGDSCLIRYRTIG